MSLFLIEKSWYDSLTSMSESDCGYDILGYVESENIAKHIVVSGGKDKRPYFSQPIFRYTKIEKYNKLPANHLTLTAKKRRSAKDASIYMLYFLRR